MLDFGWKLLNKLIGRMTLVKSVIIVAYVVLAGVLYFAYSNRQSIIDWANKKPEPAVASCIDIKGDVTMGPGSSIQANCPGKVDGPMTVWPQPTAAPQIANQAANLNHIAGLNEMHLVALSLIGPRQYTPVTEVAAAPAPAAPETSKKTVASNAKNKQSSARTRLADAKPQRKSSKLPDDPFLLRTFRAIPQEESITAFRPLPPMTGSCFALPFMTCYEPIGYGRETPVRVDYATQRIIQAHGLY